MPSQTTLELDGRDLMHRVTVRVKIKHAHEMQVRAWIGGRLLHLGAWIAGCKLEFSDEGELREKRDADNALTLRHRILGKREELNISQQALANQAGISRNYVSMIERGEANNLSVGIVERLADALDTTPFYLLGYADEPPERTE